MTPCQYLTFDLYFFIQIQSMKPLPVKCCWKSESDNFVLIFVFCVLIRKINLFEHYLNVLFMNLCGPYFIQSKCQRPRMISNTQQLPLRIFNLSSLLTIFTSRSVSSIFSFQCINESFYSISHFINCHLEANALM